MMGTQNIVPMMVKLEYGEKMIMKTNGVYIVMVDLRN